jgi:hypothetical protein
MPNDERMTKPGCEETGRDHRFRHLKTFRASFVIVIRHCKVGGYDRARITRKRDQWMK